MMMTWYIPMTSNFNPRSLTGATVGILPTYTTSQHFNPRSLTGATKMLAL